MDKLLVICGPTATGKTTLALHLAKLISGEVVSADSRQVFKEMDIGTGKDLPRGSRLISGNPKLPGFYKIEGIKVWGYDLVSPNREFSVSHYLRKISKVIVDINKRGILPILVGGTGLYIEAVVDGIPTVTIPRSVNLRKELEETPPEDLFETLALVDPVKAASLNTSDRKNPRRLVRAIEVAQWKLQRGKFYKEQFIEKRGINPLFIGLTASKDTLCNNIKTRVRKRIKQGQDVEVKRLLNQGIGWEVQAMDSLGYKEWKGYFQGEKGLNEVIKEWEKNECKYAKRQITWLKRDKRINWFDVDDINLLKNIETLVKRWYKDKENAKEN